MYGYPTLHIYAESFLASARRNNATAVMMTGDAVCEDRRENGRRCIIEHVREHGYPDALICIDDETAIGAYKGLLDIAVRVPGDVAVIGCDGIRDTEYLECPLSTMQTPFEEMCATAWEYLKNRIEDTSIPLQQATMFAELILRQSSDPAEKTSNTR